MDINHAIIVLANNLESIENNDFKEAVEIAINTMEAVKLLAQQ